MLARYKAWLAAKRWRRIAVDVALVLLVLGAVTLWQGRHLVGSGEPAPALAMRGLDGKRYDVVINQVGITEERKQKYDFSKPYIASKAALVVKGDNTTITGFARQQRLPLFPLVVSEQLSDFLHLRYAVIQIPNVNTFC